MVQVLVQDLLHGCLHQPIQLIPDLALINSDHVSNIARLAAIAYACLAIEASVWFLGMVCCNYHP